MGAKQHPFFFQRPQFCQIPTSSHGVMSLRPVDLIDLRVMMFAFLMTGSEIGSILNTEVQRKVCCRHLGKCFSLLRKHPMERWPHSGLRYAWHLRLELLPLSCFCLREKPVEGWQMREKETELHLTFWIANHPTPQTALSLNFLLWERMNFLIV